MDALAELKNRDLERWLAALWVPARARAAFAAVMAFDLELERVVAELKEPLLAELRLAWWRERLAELAGGAQPPAQPLLAALAAHAAPAGVDLLALSCLEDALLPLLADLPADLEQVAQARGRVLASAIAQATGTPAAPAAGARVCLARFLRRPWGRAGPAVADGLVRLAAAPAAFEAPAPGHALAGLDRLARADLAAWRARKPLARPGTPLRQLRLLGAALF